MNSINNITLDPSISLRNKQKLDNLNSTIDEILKDNAIRFKDSIEAPAPPYNLYLMSVENKLQININTADQTNIETIILPFNAFRRIIKDYIIVVESYHNAISNAYESAKIETIDMGRRGLHNEGADLVKEYFTNSVEIDYETCRKLFTIIYLLNLRS